MKRVVALLTMMLGVRAASAGEQLTVDELTRKAEVVVVVDRKLLPQAPEERVVVEWLKGMPAAGLDPSVWKSPCVPSRETLSKWLDGHPTHPGRATWKKILGDGATKQVVYLAPRDGGLSPTCETEVMLGTGFSAHPDFDKTRARILELVAAAKPAASAPSTASMPPPAVAPALSSPAPAVASPPVVPENAAPGSAAGSGCW